MDALYSIPFGSFCMAGWWVLRLVGVLDFLISRKLEIGGLRTAKPVG
jgi:hypothetical protein